MNKGPNSESPQLGEGLRRELVCTRLFNLLLIQLSDKIKDNVPFVFCVLKTESVRANLMRT